MKYFKIEVENDVREFIIFLVKRFDLVFHPDTDFRDYVEKDTGRQSFTEKQALYFNDLVTMCFKVCMEKELDIYEVGLSVMYPHMMHNED